ncbi:MAG: hypothetical protein MZW92_01630 [Comamonadaceae bacterium]|nr:hypothetical protein [Comamonadaceae bacterium]
MGENGEIHPHPRDVPLTPRPLLRRDLLRPGQLHHLPTRSSTLGSSPTSRAPPGSTTTSCSLSAPSTPSSATRPSASSTPTHLASGTPRPAT